ncbi:MAG: UvrD-helicase domain-containing protein [Clostridia bacterium]|nr:UvrD-helicase domain-containing protein [Clostridia bacterium]
MLETNEILKTLNEEQIKPVLATEGAVLVLAGAGSGKTRVLTSRIAYLVHEKGVPARAILAITFTNKAANEMKERVSRLVDSEGMWVCTIHSMCVRILRTYAEEVGIHPNFSIYSETERANVIKKSFQECGYDDEKLLKEVKYHIANAKMLGQLPDRYLQENVGEPEIEKIVKVYARYQAHLRENNALDFDDLLGETRILLKNNAEAREYLSSRFRYILVDEFQDTNEVQYDIVKLLSSVHGNLFVVGDDDQSIYGWRGAKIENILHFERDFPGTKVFKLERNYRSTKAILKVANAVIKNNGRRKSKTLWTQNADGETPQVKELEEESGEARFIAHTIAGLMNKGYRFSDFAVLMRLNALTRSLEQEFLADGIPFKVFGGFKFYERKEIKDLLAYLRLINNPFDSEAITRIINVPKRGIGAKTVELLQNYAYETELTVYDALLDLDEIGISGATKQKLIDFREMIKRWIIEAQETPVNELVKSIVAETQMRLAYAGDSDDSLNKLANIDEFIHSVDDYCRLNPTATLTDYLNQVSLTADTDEMDDGNYVTLATIHAVKGLEFRCVFLSGMEEGILPVTRAATSESELEEERRLTYVAVTRAKERLYLTRSKSRYLYGRREPTARSRFLKELGAEVELPMQTRFAYRRGYDEDGFYPDEDYDDGYSYAKKSSYGGGYSYGSSSQYSTQTKRVGTYTGSVYKPSAAYGSYSRNEEPKKTVAYGGSMMPQKPKPAGGKDVSAFQIGVRVSHPKFGEGTIVSVKGTGANTIADIAFKGFGIKQLSVALAPLTVLS